MLHYTVICYTILYCTILYYIISHHYTKSNHTTLHYIILYYYISLCNEHFILALHLLSLQDYVGADLCDESGLFWMDYSEIINDCESIDVCMLQAPGVTGLQGPSLPATVNNRNQEVWSKSRYCFHFETEDSLCTKAGISSDKWGAMSKCKSEEQVGDKKELAEGMQAETEIETEVQSEDMVTAKKRDSGVENNDIKNENKEAERKQEAEEKGGEEKEIEEEKKIEEEIERGQEEVMEDTSETLAVTAPVYLLTLLEPCDSMYMSVLQPRSAYSDKCIDVRLSVLKYVHGSPPQYVLIATTSLHEAQGQSDKMSLDAGQYFIILTSTGCHMRQYIADLCALSTPTSPHHTVQSSNTEGSIPGVCGSSSSCILRVGAAAQELFTPSIAAAYSHLFHRLDIDNDSHLSRSALERFIILLEGEYVLSDDIYKWFLNTFDSTSRGLTEKGFLDLQFQTFKGHNYSGGSGSTSSSCSSRSNKGYRERERERQREMEGILLELHSLGYRSTRICCSARLRIGIAVEKVELDVEVGVDKDKEGRSEVLQMPSSGRSMQEESKSLNETMKETITDTMTAGAEEGERDCEQCHTFKNKVKPSSSHGGVKDLQRKDKSSSSSSSSCACSSTPCPCDLMYVSGRAAVITLHTSVEHDLRACQPNSTLSSIATELAIMTQGKAFVLQCCTLYVHTYSESHLGTGGASFLVVNTSDETLQFRLDCSDSTNMSSSTGKLICTNTIVHGASKIILHLRYALESP
jgi:hypothetical protein